jgi:RimJ/RimL family protein N-acetyltransferase
MNVTVLASSAPVVLRRYLASDVEHHIRWRSHGEWRFFDAPWYGYWTTTSAQQEQRDREWFAEQISSSDPESYLNRRAVIATPEGIPIGDVCRYSLNSNPHVWYVGIGICEDGYLNRGLGTEALRLWVDYLFTISDVHKLCLETWSFNPRMIRAAEKVGFVQEGRLREMRLWEGEWVDFTPFGLLRRGWEARRTG